MNKKENKKMETNSLIRSSSAEYLTFIAATGEGGVEAIYADENIWLSQKMMGALYNMNVRTVNEHLQKIFKDNELQVDTVVRKFRITASDGKNYNTSSAKSPDFEVVNFGFQPICFRCFYTSHRLIHTSSKSET